MRKKGEMFSERGGTREMRVGREMMWRVGGSERGGNEELEWMM